MEQIASDVSFNASDHDEESVIMNSNDVTLDLEDEGFTPPKLTALFILKGRAHLKIFSKVSLITMLMRKVTSTRATASAWRYGQWNKGNAMEMVRLRFFILWSVYCFNNKYFLQLGHVGFNIVYDHPALSLHQVLADAQDQPGIPIYTMKFACEPDEPIIDVEVPLIPNEPEANHPPAPALPVVLSSAVNSDRTRRRIMGKGNRFSDIGTPWLNATVHQVCYFFADVLTNQYTYIILIQVLDYAPAVVVYDDPKYREEHHPSRDEDPDNCFEAVVDIGWYMWPA